MDRKKRAARREKMADMVSSGERPDEVARRFKVSISTVYAACKSSGVPPSSSMNLENMALKIVALSQAGLDEGVISEKVGASLQRVRSVLSSAKSMGVIMEARET